MPGNTCSLGEPNTYGRQTTHQLSQAFSFGGGRNYVFANVYDEENTTSNALYADLTGTVDITGSDGEEDAIVQSVARGNTTVCKALTENSRQK